MSKMPLPKDPKPPMKASPPDMPKMPAKPKNGGRKTAMKKGMKKAC